MRLYFVAATAALALLAGATSPASIEDQAAPAVTPAFDGSLTVLTYNVKGLPWPVALGRSSDLQRIGAQLRAMHSRGNAPHVVVMQEAFTSDAQAIGRAAGYRYIAYGPGMEDVRSPKMSKEDAEYATGARWWKGETTGKFVGSGLQILSDYPIVAVHRMAYSDHACAGYDCLANKGAMLVTINIPGSPTPIDILTTHLNSRRASGVSNARSIYGYRRQVGELAAFVRRTHDRRFPLIAAGDYNVGSAKARRAALLGTVRSGWGTGFEVLDAYGQFQRQGGILGDEAAYSFKRAKDWQLFSDGSLGRLNVIGIEVLFGRDRVGNMLSDHIGYVARFAISAPNPCENAAAAKVTDLRIASEPSSRLGIQTEFLEQGPTLHTISAMSLRFLGTSRPERCHDAETGLSVASRGDCGR